MSLELSDKEALKVLAEAVKDNYYENNNNDADRCRYCDCILHVHDWLNIKHKDDCPYLLAEEILNDN